MSRLSRFTTRKSKKKERTLGVPFVLKLLGSIYSLSSFVTRRWQGKEGGSPRKAGFSEASFSRDKTRYPGTSLIRYCCVNVLKIWWIRDMKRTKSSMRGRIRYTEYKRRERYIMPSVCISASVIIKYFHLLYFTIFYSFNRLREWKRAVVICQLIIKRCLRINFIQRPRFNKPIIK